MYDRFKDVRGLSVAPLTIALALQLGCERRLKKIALYASARLRIRSTPLTAQRAFLVPTCPSVSEIASQKRFHHGETRRVVKGRAAVTGTVNNFQSHGHFRLLISAQ